MVSTMCDDLIEELNAKCVDDIANRAIVAPLIETLNMVNGGQGLGVSCRFTDRAQLLATIVNCVR